MSTRNHETCISRERAGAVGAISSSIGCRVSTGGRRIHSNNCRYRRGVNRLHVGRGAGIKASTSKGCWKGAGVAATGRLI